MQKIDKLKFIPGIAWFFVVLFLMCIPGSALPHVDDWLHRIYFDKWIHVGVFGLLTVLLCWPFNKSSIGLKNRIKYFLLIAMAVSLYGYCTELIQKYWVPGRSYDLLDWAADSVGALIGLLYSRKKFTKTRASGIK